MFNRHWRLIIVFVLIALALLLSDQWLSEINVKDIAPIEKVEIEGEFENISRHEFRSEVVAAINGGYFTLDLDALRTTLMGLPWVDDVSVRRQWPSRLQIKVTEKRAVAYWNEDALISDRGDVFKPVIINYQQDLPGLKGPKGLHEKMWLFLSTLNKKFSTMGFEVVDLNLDERRAWTFHFKVNHGSEKIEVKLGRDNAENRLTRFVRVFTNMDKFDYKSIAVIDLRYPNGFAMRIKNNAASKQELVREA